MDFWKMHKEIGQIAFLFQEGIFPLHASKVISPFPKPWQALPQKTRDMLLTTATEPTNTLFGFSPFRWAYMAEGCLLGKYCADAFARQQEDFMPGKRPRYVRTGSLSPSGEETLAVLINWKRFNNREIIACFGKWVRKNRPKNVEAWRGRGHKDNEWRVALEDLGIMRAMNAHANREENFPKLITQARERGKNLYRARTRALLTFRKLFRFLPPKQRKPISWTKAKQVKTTYNR